MSNPGYRRWRYPLRSRSTLPALFESGQEKLCNLCPLGTFSPTPLGLLSPLQSPHDRSSSFLALLGSLGFLGQSGRRLPPFSPRSSSHPILLPVASFLLWIH